MTYLFDPRLFPLIITALFAAGAIRYAFALDWPLPMDALRSTARRPGADDYRRIPSLFCGKRIPRGESC